MLFFSLLLVLFPFVTPVLEKMNLTLFPSEALDFFKNVFIKMKKERGKGSDMVSPAQEASSHPCAVLLSVGETWWLLQKLCCVTYSQ